MSLKGGGHASMALAGWRGSGESREVTVLAVAKNYQIIISCLFIYTSCLPCKAQSHLYFLEQSLNYRLQTSRSLLDGIVLDRS